MNQQQYNQYMQQQMYAQQPQSNPIGDMIGNVAGMTLSMLPWILLSGGRIPGGAMLGRGMSNIGSRVASSPYTVRAAGAGLQGVQALPGYMNRYQRLSPLNERVHPLLQNKVQPFLQSLLSSPLPQSPASGWASSPYGRYYNSFIGG